MRPPKGHFKAKYPKESDSTMVDSGLLGPDIVFYLRRNNAGQWLMNDCPPSSSAFNLALPLIYKLVK